MISSVEPALMNPIKDVRPDVPQPSGFRGRCTSRDGRGRAMPEGDRHGEDRQGYNAQQPPVTMLGRARSCLRRWSRRRAGTIERTNGEITSGRLRCRPRHDHRRRVRRFALFWCKYSFMNGLGARSRVQLVRMFLIRFQVGPERHLASTRAASRSVHSGGTRDGVHGGDVDRGDVDGSGWPGTVVQRLAQVR